MAQRATILLLTGDYPDRLNALWQAAQQAKQDETPLLAGELHPYEALRDDYEALKAEAERDGVRVVLEGVGRREWRRLREAHPPRTEGDEDTVKADRTARVNVDTVEDDLVFASLVEPEFETREAFDEWADALSEGEWQTVLRRSFGLANIAQYDPKALPPLPTRSSDES